MRNTNPSSLSDGPDWGITAYVAVALIAGSIIALQIAVMRVFSVGNWAHFGSLVVSLAMLGFGMASVVLFAFKEVFERRWRAAAGAALCLFGPLAVASNLTAQAIPFNAVFIASDPTQKWRLLANFVLYLLPFLSGAFFLGVIFLKSRQRFNRANFADLTGSGLAGLIILAALYCVPPEKIIAVPLALRAGAVLIWFSRMGFRWFVPAAVLCGFALAAYFVVPGLLGVPAIHVTQYKGVSYARNFPDAKRIYRSISPFGDLQIYKSSYMHFAPGLTKLRYSGARRQLLPRMTFHHRRKTVPQLTVQ